MNQFFNITILSGNVIINTGHNQILNTCFDKPVSSEFVHRQDINYK